MSSDVVLSAALRSNLLSLQGTQKGIDSSQFKLSTGKKVNSALDNPQSFFASQALTNRASDLTKLLDGIGQSIQVIKAADNGVTALTSLVNQAQAIATTAQDTVSAASGAKAVGNVNITAVNVGTVGNFAGLIAAGTTDTFDVTAIDSNGVQNKQSIGINLGDTGAVVAAKITAAFASTGAQITATTDATTGFLTLSAASGNSIRIDNFRTSAGALYTEAQGGTAVTALGIANYFAPNSAGATSGAESVVGAATFLKGATINASGTSISSKALTSNGTVATLGTKVKDLAGFNLSSTINTSLLAIGVDGGVVSTVDLQSTNGLTVQGLVDKINALAPTKYTASFDATSGKLSINIIDATVKVISIANNSTAATSFNFGFGSGRADGSVADTIGEVFAVPSTAAATNSTLTSLQTQYNNIRTQIDALVTNGDTAYRGTNLLNGNNLVTNFNELRTSKLTTTGVTFNSSGLGLLAANFSTSTAISTNLTQITTALTSLRNFGSSIATDLSTIQSRQDFTSELINTLTTGSDLLTNADQNEEGAKLLALQTRQSLGVTALSLASQSQQSILRLFG